MRRRKEREILEKARPTASSGTIPTCEDPVTRPGTEPGSPRREASPIALQFQRSVLLKRMHHLIQFAARIKGATYLDVFSAFEPSKRALKFEVLTADEGEAAPECKRGGGGIAKKTCRPTASSVTIPTCKNPVTRLGIEPGSSSWEKSVLIAHPPLPQHNLKLYTYNDINIFK
ncbi:hypothetical protein PR048_009820 [Dryococelus australis]|uniref:Uncharacterized protein n=1 Tax=Dryococelus australis TaxID=614101 RepID=A0ABQ9I0Z4_9NEOP|nr:hypothetical protein PR048_009820 [Dryococelus australis]